MNPDNMLVSDAKKELFENLPEGTTCPCCGQHAKMYRRSLTKSMIRALVKIANVQVGSYPNHENIWVHMPSLGFKGGDPSKLRWFSLIEQRELRDDEKEDGTKRTSGYWRLTGNGWSFLEGTAKIPDSVLLYNNKLFGVSENRITVEDAMGTDFSYKELMRSSSMKP